MNDPTTEQLLRSIFEGDALTMLETHKYMRKQFSIDAVQITERNMVDVAAWTGGTVIAEEGKAYIKVDVYRPLNVRQSQGFVGDWVLWSGTGFKVYTKKAFRDSFEQVSVETTLHDVSNPRVTSALVEEELPQPPVHPPVVPVNVSTTLDKVLPTAPKPAPPAASSRLSEIPGVTSEQVAAFEKAGNINAPAEGLIG